MAKPRHLEFFALRYVPNVVSAEQINVGIVAFERQEGRITFAEARFTKRLDRISAFDPDADLEMLEATFREMQASFEEPEKAERFVNMMLETFSNVIQVSDRQEVLLSGDPASEVDRLASLYLLSSAAR